MAAEDKFAICAAVEVAVPAEDAFAFMADGLKQNHWALGSVDRRTLGDGLFVGRSSFDGSDLYVRLTSHPDLLLVDYATGPSPEELLPRNEARVRRGSWVGRDDSVSVITLTTWRGAGVEEEDWQFRHHLWQTEVRLIKGALERRL
jgi:hypothetical protein